MSPSRQPPQISILMLTYNRPQMIPRAIESIFRQTHTNWELIIVQDGDNAETERLVAEWLERDPARIHFFRRGLVGTIAEASNFGLEQARGEYVAILDDDDWWAADDKLARQTAFLDAHPDHVGIGGGYVVVDQDGRRRGSYSKPELDEQIRSNALVANPVANSTAMFRRMIGGRPALYDASLRQFADWDFWLTLGAQGKLHNFPDNLAYYALWEGGSSFKNQTANARAGLRIVMKHRRAYRRFYLALPVSLLYLGYSHLPVWMKRLSYEWLSALKKAVTARGPAASTPAEGG